MTYPAQAQSDLGARIATLLTKSRHYFAPNMSGPSAYDVIEGKQAGARILYGYASVFGIVDVGGDLIVAGAFDTWLASFDGEANPLPLLREHRRGDVNALLGWIRNVVADQHGLHITAWLLPEKGEEVLYEQRRGIADGLSIGYRPIDGREPTAAERALGARRVLTDVDLAEVSVVRDPMNTSARVTAVKARTHEIAATVRRQLAAQPFARTRMRKRVMPEAEQRILAGRVAALVARAR